MKNKVNGTALAWFNGIEVDKFPEIVKTHAYNFKDVII